jgi:hypothetical protein
MGEIAFQFFQHDCDVTVLAAGALARRARASFSAAYDHEYLDTAGHRGELDLFAFVDGGLYLGESKANGAIDNDDCAKLRQLARRMNARAVVIATMTECEGGCSSSCVRDQQDRLGTSDTALHGTATGDSPRARLLRLRRELAPAIPVLVLCRADLVGGLRA